MTESRKHHPAADKVAILRRHLLEKVPVSDLCQEYGIHPTVFYRWQKTFFENGAAAFDGPRAKQHTSAETQRITALEAKLRRKDEVLSELMEEHVALKKNLGEI